MTFISFGTVGFWDTKWY